MNSQRPPEAPTGHSAPTGVTAGRLEGYAESDPATPRVHDEAVDDSGVPRPDYAGVLGRIRELGAGELERRWAAAEQGLLDDGITLHSEEGERPYPIDVVPRLISAPRWAEVAAGLEQRARAIDAFLADVYGEGEIVAAGRVDRDRLQRNRAFTEAGHAVPPGVVRAGVCGMDLVSPATGRWVVLEDNLRMPGGLAMAQVNRRVMEQHFADVMPGPGSLLEPGESFGLLAESLRACAPEAAHDRSGGPTVVMVSPGPSDTTWYEQQVIAREIGAELVTVDALVAEDGRLWRVDGGHRHPVDVLNPRMGETELLDAAGADGRPLRRGLLEAIAGRGVTVVNAPGNGLGDDKATYALVPEFIDFYLGETPLLDQITTLRCAVSEQREQVLDRLAELVVKPIDGYGGAGITVGPECSPEELEQRRREIEESPEKFVAQEVVPLSTLPRYSGGRLQPVHVDLRAYVFQRPDGHGRTVAQAAPTALTRFAPEGTMIVNVSSGGGGKDTWIDRG